MAHLLVALLLAGFTLQPAPADLSGSWAADLNGVTFMRLELRTINGRLAGAIGTGDLHLDAAGVVDSAKPAPKTLTPIANITMSRNVMAFTRVEGDDVERFRFRITGKDTAELTFLPSDEDLEELKEAGIPPPKPITLRKVN